MNILYGTYIFLLNTLFIPWLFTSWLDVVLRGKSCDRLKGRLGVVPSCIIRSMSGSPRIWIHAVSLGEINVGVSIIDALRKILPNSSIILSTTTKHGYNRAIQIFANKLPIIYAPIDFILPIRKVLYALRPHVIVFLETEIWPTWINEAKRMGIKIAVVNGRISRKSIGQYLRIRPLFYEILKNIDAFSMIREEDAVRIRKMGAQPNKIIVNGNAKYDLLPTLTNPSIKARFRKILNIKASHRVFIAGSTREGEETLILDAYEEIRAKYPDLLLIIVPRHIRRTQEIVELLKIKGHEYQLRSELDGHHHKRTKKIIIINTFGELFGLYSIGTIIFCGGSLVPKGGQNPFEAAIWGKVVFYGPFMDNFLDAKERLEHANAGICVSTPNALAEKAIWFIQNPNILSKRGTQARETVMMCRGSAKKHGLVIADLVDQRLIDGNLRNPST